MLLFIQVVHTYDMQPARCVENTGGLRMWKGKYPVAWPACAPKNCNRPAMLNATAWFEA